MKSKKGFTLMEIMIVISIIGTLATVLYPQISNYILKARVVNYQNTIAETIRIINLYRSEVGELGIDGSWCFSENDDASCTDPSRHVAMSDFITKNNPQLHQKLQTFFYNPTYAAFLTVIYSYKTLTISLGSSIDIGRDMNTPIGMLQWDIFDRAPGIPDGYMLYPGTGYDDSMPELIESGVTSLPLELDKVCYPGRALAGLSFMDIKFTQCYYLFE